MARQRRRVERVTPRGRVRGGSVKVYVVCTGGSGRGARTVSGYFSVRPGWTIEDLDRAIKRELESKLIEDSLPGTGGGDASDIHCTIMGSLGDLPPGSSAYEVE